MGHGNTATGAFSQFRNTVGDGNAAYGDSALFNNDCGNSNTAIGVAALYQNNCGSGNSALGANAGIGVFGDNNIDIGSPGQGFDSNTIRIGDPFTVQFKTYIARHYRDSRCRRCSSGGQQRSTWHGGFGGAVQKGH